VIDIVSKILGYTFYSPCQICIGINHIYAHTSCKVAEITDVWVPRVRDRLSLFIVYKETEYRWSIHRRIAIGKINPHLIASGKDRHILCTKFSEMLNICYTADTFNLVADEIGSR
jgi:hypothetical protein